MCSSSTDRTFFGSSTTPNPDVGGPSSVYALLPLVVRSRIPVLTSFRRSARGLVSKASLYPSTLPADHGVLTSTTPVRNQRAGASSIGPTLPAIQADTFPPWFSGSGSKAQPSISTSNQSTRTGGIDWTVADAGVRLWLIAHGQTESRTRDPTLLRSMHIDALRYMSIALPDDLSISEIQSIQSSLPAQVLRPQDRYQQVNFAQRSNILRQGVAQAVCWIIALTVMMIPLLMRMINMLLVFEQKHHIARRAIDYGIKLTKTFGEQSLSSMNSLTRIRDTALGMATISMLLWIIEGFVGGLNDGVLRSSDSFAGPVGHRR